MNTRSVARAIVVGALLTLASGSGAAQASVSTDNAAQAEKLLKEATARAKKNDWAGAYPLLKRSFELVPAAETAANLGQTAHELGKSAEAARYLAHALRTLSPAVSIATRRSIEKMYATTKRDVAEVRLEVEPAGAEILVDGALVGRASELLDPVFLDPGSHTVEVRASGFAARSETVKAEKGTRRDLEFKLQRVENGGPTIPPVDSGLGSGGSSSGPSSDGGGAAGSSGLDPRVTVAIVGGGLSAIAIGAGVIFGLNAASAEDEEAELSDATRKKFGPDACGGVVSGAASMCSGLADKQDERQSAARWSNISFYVGAGLAVATVAAIALWPREEKSPKVTGWAASHGGGLLMGGSF